MYILSDIDVEGLLILALSQPYNLVKLVLMVSIPSIMISGRLTVWAVMASLWVPGSLWSVPWSCGTLDMPGPSSNKGPWFLGCKIQCIHIYQQTLLFISDFDKHIMISWISYTSNEQKYFPQWSLTKFDYHSQGYLMHTMHYKRLCSNVCIIFITMLFFFRNE